MEKFKDLKPALIMIGIVISFVLFVYAMKWVLELTLNR